MVIQYGYPLTFPLLFWSIYCIGIGSAVRENHPTSGYLLDSVFYEKWNAVYGLPSIDRSIEMERPLVCDILSSSSSRSSSTVVLLPKVGESERWPFPRQWRNWSWPPTGMQLRPPWMEWRRPHTWRFQKRRSCTMETPPGLAHLAYRNIVFDDSTTTEDIPFIIRCHWRPPSPPNEAIVHH
jgi:hypothetical protein